MNSFYTVNTLARAVHVYICGRVWVVFATIVLQERVAPVFTHSKRLYTNMYTAVIHV